MKVQRTATGHREKPRVLVLVGAGASIGYGAPSTRMLTELIEGAVASHEVAMSSGASEAYAKISDILAGYLKSPDGANFEQIYHVAHELAAMAEPTPNALDQFRPLLAPFMQPVQRADAEPLRYLCERMVDIIYRTISAACEVEPSALKALSDFVRRMRSEWVTRIYTTNYDDFILQSTPDLFTGFAPQPDQGPKMVDSEGIWGGFERDCLFHLHGSVHLGFASTIRADGELGDLFWFDNRAAATRNAVFVGDDEARMDGSGYIRTALVTGLDKLSRLQRSPMSHYYASFARDVMNADLIVVIGYGMTDLHLNSWIAGARRKAGGPPILLVDKWDDAFLTASVTGWGRRETTMLHDFRINARGRNDGTQFGTGWTLARDGTSAIWDRGFEEFLEAPGEFEDALARIGFGTGF